MTAFLNSASSPRARLLSVALGVSSGTCGTVCTRVCTHACPQSQDLTLSSRELSHSAASPRCKMCIRCFFVDCLSPALSARVFYLFSYFNISACFLNYNH